ncbi:MAG TPA: helix-turn-helix domain-containing protein [Pseudonocardia sp.]|nr:helix-turn-helix domain-containing protein [Pseudonocardia sp.]
MAHLALAMTRYARDLRRDRLSVPPMIDELAALLRSCARSCPPTTRMDDEESTTQDGTVAGPLLITKAEAGEYLSVSIRTVERLISGGKLPLVHVEGAARLRVTDVEAYVASLTSAESTGSSRSGGRVR